MRERESKQDWDQASGWRQWTAYVSILTKIRYFNRNQHLNKVSWLLLQQSRLGWLLWPLWSWSSSIHSGDWTDWSRKHTRDKFCLLDCSFTFFFIHYQPERLLAWFIETITICRLKIEPQSPQELERVFLHNIILFHLSLVRLMGKNRLKSASVRALPPIGATGHGFEFKHGNPWWHSNTICVALQDNRQMPS